MKNSPARGQVANLGFVKILDTSSTTSAGLAGVSSASSGLTIWVRRELSSTITTYTGANIGAISTLGTWANPGSGKINIKQVDNSNAPGWLELHFENTIIGTGDASRCLIGEISGVTNMAPTPFEIPLLAVDSQDGVHGGMTALPNTACTTNASLLTSGTGTDQLSVTSGRIDIGKALGTAVTLDSNNVLNVSTKYMGGTLLTARDIGLSVLLSGGTGTGQISLSSGAVLLQATQTGVTIPTVTTVGTLTTYTGNTPQTGDVYAISNSGSYGNAALLSAIQNVQNNTFIATSIPYTLERPDSSSVSVTINVVFSDETGAAKNLDSGNPTVTLVNDAGTDLSSRLGSWSNPATGKYAIVYTNTSSDTIEGLHWDISGTINAKLRRMVAYTQIVDTTAVDFTSTDRTNLGTILTRSAHLDADVTSRMATYTQPTGFLSVTFPSGTLASTTNITAGTMTTVTNVTTISAGGITAASFATALKGTTSGFLKVDVEAITDLVGSATEIQLLGSDYAAGFFTADLDGDVSGKVRGTGPSTILGVGAWSLDGSGNAIASATNLAAVKAELDTATAQTTASAIRVALGLGSANLDTQIFAVYNAVGSPMQASAHPTVGGYATGQDPATLVLGATAGTWNTANTIGNKINAAGAAGDPWTAIPGDYGPTTAGGFFAAIKGKTDQLTFTNANKVDTTATATINVVSSTGGGSNLPASDKAYVVGANVRWNLTRTITGEDSTGWTSMVLTVKYEKNSDADEAAFLTIRVSNPAQDSDGLITLNGVPADDKTLASLAVSGVSPDTAVTWDISAAAMAIPPSSPIKKYDWELTRWVGTSKRAIAGGEIEVKGTLRRSPTPP